MRATLKSSRYDSEGIIANDRDLLIALGLSDAVAATYVQKSRQTLNNQLGARKDGSAPADYFKPAELLMLVLAASRDSAEFDEARKEMVNQYIGDTRASLARSKQERAAYELVMETLSSESRIDLGRAEGVIFLLPDFSGMARAQPEGVNELRRLAGRIGTMASPPWTLILSSSTYQAKMAADALEFEGDELYTVSHDHAEHYMPSVFVYEGDDNSKPFVITARGGFVFAPIYRAPMMLTCLKEMLPDALREKLFQRKPGSRKQARF